MQEQPSWGRARRRKPMSSPSYTASSQSDSVAQRAVLGVVFSEHPAQLTICEISCEINRERDFAKDDSVERAIRDLVGLGVLHCPGMMVLPTRAAMHLHRLWQ